MRADQHLTSVTVDNRSLGVFDTVSAIEIDSEETKHRPGGMGAQKSLGGPTTTSNVTVARLYELERDHDLARRLATRVGKARMVVTKQPLDVNGNPFGRPIVVQGKLKRLAYPGGDSNSADAAMLELELSTEGNIG